MKPFNVLFTRKLKDAQRRIMNPNLNLRQIEFIKIEAIDRAMISSGIANLPPDGTVVFTSANAVRFFAECVDNVSTNWKIYSLAGATWQAIAEFLKTDRVYLAAANASLLADQIIAKSESKVFFICGDRRRDELPEKLKREGIDVEEIVVYQTVSVPQKVDDHFDAVAFFSPSAVESFFMNNQIDTDSVLFSIGGTTTAAIMMRVPNEVITSDASTEQDMITSIERYMKEKWEKI